MPRDTLHFNPYRWVAVSNASRFTRLQPHHQLHGRFGTFRCWLTALTPVYIGGKAFSAAQPFIPGTSLKGVIRNIAEVVSATDAIFGEPRPGRDHTIDVPSRIFGTLVKTPALSYLGSVQVGDAQLVFSPGPRARWLEYDVLAQSPKRQHGAFYPSASRKFYHHHYGSTSLRTAANGTIRVKPAPVGSQFEFDVEYRGLSDIELGLLIYSLVLEENVQVQFGPAAIGRPDGVTLTGPLRHKVGGCKAAGGGSAGIEIIRWTERGTPESRYRVGQPGDTTRDATDLSRTLAMLTAPIRSLTNATMLDLRAMLIYAEGDPRTPIHYPSRTWFDANPTVTLRPTR